MKVLTTESMRVVERDDRGRVTKRQRFVRGDEVPEDALPDWRYEALVQSGALVDPDDTEHPDGQPEPGQGSEGSGQATDDFPSYLDKPRPDGWEDYSDDEKRAYIYGDAGQAEVDHVDPDAEKNPFADKEKYSYADLQALGRDIGDGSGGREALEARLWSNEKIKNNTL